MFFSTVSVHYKKLEHIRADASVGTAKKLNAGLYQHMHFKYKNT